MVLVKKPPFFTYIKYWLSITILLLCNVVYAFPFESFNVFPQSSRSVTDLPVLAGTTIVVEWGGGGIHRYESVHWITIGSKPEASDIFDSGKLVNFDDFQIGLLPHDGRKLYVRLWHQSADKQWKHFDRIFIAATLPAKSPIGFISPAPHSVLSSTTVTFELHTDGEKISRLGRFALTLTPEDDNTLFHFRSRVETTHTVTNLPTDARFIYAFIDYKLANGERGYVTTRYRGPGKPYLITPASGSTLQGSTVDLRWVNNNIDIEEYSIKIGRTPEADDIFSGKTLPGSNTSLRIHDLPQDGKMLFIRLGYKTEGNWKYVDRAYKAAGNNQPVNLSPFIQCFFQCKEDHHLRHYLRRP